MTHYYSQKQESISAPFRVVIRTKDDVFEIFSDSGVFSKDKLDLGSKVLIDTLLKENLAKGKILDLGCGYGAIGIALLRKSKPELTFSDVNERACKLTQRNLGLFKFKANVIHSDGFKKIKDDFDLIITNPPYAAGKKLCIELIKQSFNNLKKGGKFIFVMRRNKGGETLAKEAEKIFQNKELVNKKSGYGVYSFKKQ